MREFTRYMKDKIAHYHKDNGEVMIDTIRKFDITYKELYKIIDKSRIFRFEIIKGVRYKKCTSCNNLKPFTKEFYYKRTNGNLYSQCKVCSNLLSKLYQRENAKSIYSKRIGYFKDYRNNNRKRVQSYQQQYYGRYKKDILFKRKQDYKKNKVMFLKRLLFG